jgi:hypothetical protein
MNPGRGRAFEIEYLEEFEVIFESAIQYYWG